MYYDDKVIEYFNCIINFEISKMHNLLDLNVIFLQIFTFVSLFQKNYREFLGYLSFITTHKYLRIYEMQREREFVSINKGKFIVRLVKKLYLLNCVFYCGHLFLVGGSIWYKVDHRQLQLAPHKTHIEPRIVLYLGEVVLPLCQLRYMPQAGRRKYYALFFACHSYLQCLVLFQKQMALVPFYASVFDLTGERTLSLWRSWYRKNHVDGLIF